ncbi:Ribonuclease-like 3 [Labeo rohita]|uniref:Ribonuclease-like 3 n=1 Tax=Labeo rohita TaxID=84645 RepID=A0ABQ8L950_LABRO|nr:Ribonuclease-like 3 [Labeo rohita]
MEIHQSVVILLLVLAASFTAYGQPDDIKPRYQTFLNRHLGPHVSVHDCDKEIRKRGITASGTANGCKEVNTFIHAKENDIREVCGKNGISQGKDLFRSKKPFPVITCRLKHSEKKLKCEYRGSKSTHYIVVKCEKGWPVRYEFLIPCCDCSTPQLMNASIETENNC